MIRNELGSCFAYVDSTPAPRDRNLPQAVFDNTVQVEEKRKLFEEKRKMMKRTAMYLLALLAGFG